MNIGSFTYNVIGLNPMLWNARNTRLRDWLDVSHTFSASYEASIACLAVDKSELEPS
jgi:hypothetical protein